MTPTWLQWLSAILGPIGTFITAVALVHTIRQRNEAKRSADETAKGLQTVVETVLRSLQPVLVALRGLQQQQREVSPWVEAALTAALASQSNVVEVAKPFVRHAPGLSAVLSDIWITDVSGGTSAQGPVLETLTGKAPPIPPGTMWPIHPPEKEDDEEP